ncbi:MAG TPA: acetoacetate--CoA ligase [Gemmatimonas sp.]|nr:acetoacetate--CoA ligase [Gemmatimonas sp.]
MSVGDVAPLWTPSLDQIAGARLTNFLLDLRESGVVPIDCRDAHGLQRWSAAHPEAFWAAVWREAEISADGPGPSHAPWEEVLVGAHRMAPPDPIIGPRWFTGTRLNFAEHLLRRRDDGRAIVAWNELGVARRLTFGELAVQVARTAAALEGAGVKAGDRVAGYLPNIPEAVVVMLAASSIGAVWSSCSPDFGTKGVLDRFGQIEPVVLVVADGYRYAGKRIDCLARIREVAESIESIREVWVVPNLASSPDLSGIPGARFFADVVAPHAGVFDPVFERLPFDHPLYILYSSGTTGLPKCMVHGAGGTLLQHWKEHALHTDLRRDDVLFYFTTCGWMMWNWLVSALAVGTTIVLYDGAPLAPDANILWRMAQDEGVTVFGTSARYLATCEKLELTPGASFDLSHLRAILSTGSPLAGHSYDYVYEHVRDDIQLASISGGTDIVSCFALGDPTGPVYHGELQMRGLGMAVEVWNERGKAVHGEGGELVCTRPFPSMPVAFWNDPTGASYRAAYFDHFPGAWRHGDWAEVTHRDGLVIHGRSDATLNPGGVRIGTAEIYRQVEQIAGVLESVVVEQQMEDSDESRIVLFLRMQPGIPVDDMLRELIRSCIRERASPHHVPKVIAEVADIPRTLSGKITEIAVRDVIHGRDVRNVDALANPEALAHFRNHPALR